MIATDLDAKNRALEVIRRRKQAVERIERLIQEIEPDDLALLLAALQGSTPETSRVEQSCLAEQPNRRPRSPQPTVRKRGRRPTLDAAVRSACAELKTEIDVKTVASALTKAGVKLGAKRPSASINSVFKRMEAEGLLKQVRTGSGRVPNTYEFTGEV